MLAPRADDRYDPPRMANDPLHLIVFTDTFFETNGVGSYYRTLLAWARRTQYARVIIVCPTRPDLAAGHVDDDVIAVKPIGQFKNPFYKDLTLGHFPQRRLRRVLDEFPAPKAIHMATAGPLGIAAAKLSARTGIPAVGCYHSNMQMFSELYGRHFLGSFGGWLGRKFGLWLDLRSYGRCRGMCVPTETAAKTPREFFRGDIEIIPNPIDNDRFQPAPTRDGEFRRKYNPDGKVLAVVVGRVAREKNLDLVAEHLLHDDRIQTVFVGDGPYAATLKSQWNATVTGFLHGQDLLDAYQQADVFVQLSVNETFGLTLAEAMSCGLPVVVRRSQGFVQQIPPDHGAVVIDDADLPKLGDYVFDLAKNPERHAKYARLARVLAQQLGTDAVLPHFVDFHRRYLD